MNLFDAWAKKNKRDNSGRMGSSMLGDMDAIEDTQNTLQVNIGTGGLLSTGVSSREANYRELRTKISEETLVLLQSVFRMHKSREAIFRRLEDEKVPLTYLVALGITSEEDVQSYLTLKGRGLAMRELKNDSKIVEYDEVYAREIIAGADTYPTLLDIHGKEVQLPKAVQDVKMTYKPADAPGEPVVERAVQEEKPQEEVTFPALEEIQVHGVAVTQEDVQEESALAETKATEDVKEDEAWREKLYQIISEGDTEAKHADTDEAEQKQQEAEEEKGQPAPPRAKEVYLLADTVSIPKLQGYEFYVVRGVQDFNNFTAHRDNLLIITRDVPKKQSEMFLNWLKGVMRCGDKYRVATLSFSAIHHPIVEAELTLTQESLDSYFEQRDAKSYLGTGVGKFMDISDRLKTL